MPLKSISISTLDEIQNGIMMTADMLIFFVVYFITRKKDMKDKQFSMKFSGSFVDKSVETNFVVFQKKSLN
jgi:hypothetical protein